MRGVAHGSTQSLRRRRRLHCLLPGLPRTVELWRLDRQIPTHVVVVFRLLGMKVAGPLGNLGRNDGNAKKLDASDLFKSSFPAISPKPPIVSKPRQARARSQR